MGFVEIVLKNFFRPEIFPTSQIYIFSGLKFHCILVSPTIKFDSIFGVPNNQISLHFGVRNNQISLHFSVPNNQILLHLDVPNTNLLWRSEVKQERGKRFSSTNRGTLGLSPKTEEHYFTVQCTLYTVHISRLIFNKFLPNFNNKLFHPIFPRNLSTQFFYQICPPNLSTHFVHPIWPPNLFIHFFHPICPPNFSLNLSTKCFPTYFWHSFWPNFPSNLLT